MNFRNLVVALVGSVIAAQAHPGHDLMAHGATHVAASPYHLFVLVAVALVSFGMGQIVRSATVRRVLRATGATVLVAGVVVWGFGF